MLALANVEEAYKREREIKEAIEEVIHLKSLYHLRDTLDASEEATDENRLLPAMNKIWPFLIACIQNRNPVVSKQSFKLICCLKSGISMSFLSLWM